MTGSAEKAIEVLMLAFKSLLAVAVLRALVFVFGYDQFIPFVDPLLFGILGLFQSLGDYLAMSFNRMAGIVG